MTHRMTRRHVNAGIGAALYFQSTASRFACAYGVASLGAIRGPWKFSWSYALIFRTVPSANTLVSVIKVFETASSTN